MRLPNAQAEALTIWLAWRPQAARKQQLMQIDLKAARRFQQKKKVFHEETTYSSAHPVIANGKFAIRVCYFAMT